MTRTVAAVVSPADDLPTAAMEAERGPKLPPTFCLGDFVAGRFRIVRFIAQGGMGEVYEAEDDELGEHVALKTIRQKIAADEQAVERFRKEVLLARKVTHPNVCRIFDVFRHKFPPNPSTGEPGNEVVFLTMELLQGVTLSEHLRRVGRLSAEEALPLAEQMAAALDAAHRAGIAHRDFKSNNVVLMAQADGTLRAVVTDFGLAGAHNDRAQPQDAEGFAMGTPAYMAPEQVEGGEITAAADIYSLGIVLYEMMTAAFPFIGLTAAATANLRLRQSPRPPRDYRPDLEPRWESAILRCLERKPEDRFAGAVDVIEALRPARPPSEAPARSRRRVLAEIAVGLALAGIAGVAVWKSRQAGPFAGPLNTVQVTTSAGLDLFPSISPDGQRLAYTSDRSGVFEIYVRNLAPDANDVPITHDGAQNFQPSWSPDGQHVAYHCNTNGGLWVVALDGGEPRRLTTFGSRPAWSPSGRYVAFQSEGLVDLAANAVAAMPPSTLWVVPADGGSPRQLTSPGNPPGGHGGPEWSPDEKRIVFTASDRRASSVWSVGAVSGDLLMLSASQTYAYDPTYAADGRRVYFAALSSGGNYGMWSLDVSPEDGHTRGEAVQIADLGLGTSRHLAISRDGRQIAFSALRMSSNLWRLALTERGEPQLRPLTSETGRNSRPMFSPDGRRIAFDRWQAGTNPDVWTMDAAGGSPARVTTSPSIDTVPNWGAGGESLVFLSDRSGHPAVWSRRLADKREELLFDAGQDLDWARLSPDGRSLVFNRRTPDGIVNVWRVELSGGEPRQLTFDAEFAGFPCWSPDGKLLAVQLKRGEGAQIAVMPATGGTPEVLTSGDGQSWPYSWAADGDRIAFAGYRDGFWNVYSVSRATRRERLLTHYARLNAYVRYPAWSPASDLLVYEYAETTGNIWLLEGLK